MACRYCFARYTHGFLGLDDRSAFERRIYVKDADRDRLVVSRDAALLREISAASDVTVNLSITTVDPALARRLEPRAPRADLRFAAMKALADAGVAAHLFIMPILSRLTDDEPNLRSRLAAACDACAIGAESNVLFLRPGTREIFLEVLAVDFPGLVAEHDRLYRGSPYAAPDYVGEIEARVRRLADEVGLSSRRRADRPDRSAPRQLSLHW